MGINIQINGQQFLNQFDNGVNLDLSTTTNTSFLTGNCGELLKNTIEVQISWTSESSGTDVFEVNGNTLTRSGSGDFITDGFVLGGCEICNKYTILEHPKPQIIKLTLETLKEIVKDFEDNKDNLS